jgi:protein TonB
MDVFGMVQAYAASGFELTMDRQDRPYKVSARLPGAPPRRGLAASLAAIATLLAPAGCASPQPPRAATAVVRSTPAGSSRTKPEAVPVTPPAQPAPKRGTVRPPGPAGTDAAGVDPSLPPNHAKSRSVPDAIKTVAMPVPVTEPRPVQPIRIEYPELARKLGHEGTVDVELTVSESGAVTQARVARSSGSQILDVSARSTLAATRFEPARRNGAAIPYVFRQPVRFILKEAR